MYGIRRWWSTLIKHRETAKQDITCTVSDGGAPTLTTAKNKIILNLRLNYIRDPLSLMFVTDWSFKLFWSHISPLSLRFVTDWSFKLF